MGVSRYILVVLVAALGLLVGAVACEGPLGPAGSQGPAGETGRVGSQGPAGETGRLGAPGPAGETGRVGAPGPAGETGLAGALQLAGQTCPAGEFLTGFDAQGNVVCGTSSGLPPDPGVSGTATLQGIDSDNDGLRDDVQIAILQRYPDDAVRQAVLDQTTIALQDSILAGSSADSAQIFQAATLVIRAVDCMHETMDDSSSEISFIEDAVINTPERSAAYITFNESLNGQFFGASDSGNPCE